VVKTVLRTIMPHINKFIIWQNKLLLPVGTYRVQLVLYFIIQKKFKFRFHVLTLFLFLFSLTTIHFYQCSTSEDTTKRRRFLSSRCTRGRQTKFTRMGKEFFIQWTITADVVFSETDRPSKHSTAGLRRSYCRHIAIGTT
jgi:hypothetical protein